MDIKIARQIIETAIKQRQDEVTALQVSLDLLNNTYAPDFVNLQIAQEEANTLAVEKQQAIVEKQHAIEEKETQLIEKENVILEKEDIILEKEALISEKNAIIAQKESEIAELQPKEIITDEPDIKE